MIELVILALALSMDAFAVSIGLGSKQSRSPLRLALMSGVYFGVFQGLMPFIGYLGGRGVLGWVEGWAPWLAFFLLMFIGIKMLYESFTEGVEEGIANITPRIMLTLAIATSVDAMAAGFTLTLLDVGVVLACLIIAVTTFLFSFVGVFIGYKSGVWLESRAELLGGIVLILMAFRMLTV